MVAASCPISNMLRFSGGGATTISTARLAASSVKLFHHISGKRLFSNYLRVAPRNYRCYSFGRGIGDKLQSDRFVCNAFARDASESNSSEKFAVLLEVEGVLMDVYRLCNREAFNTAFKKLGLDCANWSAPVYNDLVRKSVGDEERMLILFFNRIGWPTSVATSEQGAFMKKVLREKKNALDDLVKSEAFSLRPGAEEFIDEACSEGVPVVILAAYSSSGEKVARLIAEKLGTDRMSKTTIVGDNEVKQSFYGQLVFGKGSSSLDDQLAKEVSKAAAAEKQRIAEEVASMLKLKVELSNNSSESLQNIVAALRTGAEYAEVPVRNCILIAGSRSGVAAAERIGMPCVVLRCSVTARAEFPSAISVMDGFGGADLTISKLRRKLSS